MKFTFLLFLSYHFFFSFSFHLFFFSFCSFSIFLPLTNKYPIFLSCILFFSWKKRKCNRKRIRKILKDKKAKRKKFFFFPFHFLIKRIYIATSFLFSFLVFLLFSFQCSEDKRPEKSTRKKKKRKRREEQPQLFLSCCLFFLPFRFLFFLFPFLLFFRKTQIGLHFLIKRIYIVCIIPYKSSTQFWIQKMDGFTQKHGLHNF